MDMRRAERTLVEVGGILDGSGVPFFLVLGTCLGVVRDGRLIEWDTDIDLGALVEHLSPAIPRLESEFRAAGFRVVVKSNPCEFPMAMRLVRGCDHVDIAGFLSHDDKRYSPSGRKRYSIVYPARLLENTEPVSYLGREWMVPSPPAEYLRCHYGPGWRTPNRAWRSAMGRARVEGYYGSIQE